MVTSDDGLVVANYTGHDDEFLLLDAAIREFDCDEFCLHDSHKEEA
jgi:hypothetical protein